MIKFTLDTNCVVDVDENREAAPFVKKLIQAHLERRADVSVVAIMASEKQRAGGYLETFEDFTSRLSRLGMSDLGLCLPFAIWGMCFYDHALYGDVETSKFHDRIHNVLFPNVACNYADFCHAQGIDPGNKHKGIAHEWRNKKIDVLALGSHINAKRDVFVTTDGEFHKLTKRQILISLGAGDILYPSQAAKLCDNLL